MALAANLFKDSHYGSKAGGTCELPIFLVRTFAVVCKKIIIVAYAYYLVARFLMASTFVMDCDVDRIQLSIEGAHALSEATQRMLEQLGALDKSADDT